MEMVGTSWPFAIPAAVPDTDERLLQRAASGDMAAFDQVWQRHVRLLRVIAYSVLRCDSDVDEVLHAAWSLAWEGCPTYAVSRGSASRWLRTLVRNKSIDRLRRVRCRLALSPRYAQWLSCDHPAQHSAYDHLVASETAQRIAAALAHLAPLQARVIRCAYFEGMTHAEISARLGMPMGTIKACIRRGLIKLRSTLRSSLPASA